LQKPCMNCAEIGLELRSPVAELGIKLVQSSC
jgi:hypothetical protein